MIAGPVACTLLADFGAEVIKVEEPKKGDPLRHIGPFVDAESLIWNVEGRNKKSITLDLRSPEGQEIVVELAKHVDAVVENFRPGTLDKWGIGYTALSKANPKLIVLSISGFGQTGPYRARAAYDRIALAFGGTMHLTGYPDRPPVKFGVSIADYQSSLFGALALMMALYNRDALNGSGQHIDLALYESVFRFTDSLASCYDQLGLVRQRQGNIGLAAAPGDHFETADGRFLILTISNTAMFDRLCGAMQRCDLAADPRYKTHESRFQHIAELNQIVARWIKSEETASICRKLNAVGIAYSLVFSIADIFADPHYQERQSIQTVVHKALGSVRMQGTGPKFSITPAAAIKPAPSLGEHTAEIFSEWLGLDAEAIDRLRAKGVI